VGLNNCVQVDAMGNMGNDQLAWLKSNLAGLESFDTHRGLRAYSAEDGL